MSRNRRLLHHSALGSRVTKKKEKRRETNHEEEEDLQRVAPEEVRVEHRSLNSLFQVAVYSPS